MKKFDKIYVEITNICNFKCSFCPDTNREKKYMKVEEFQYIIEKIKNYTDIVMLHVKGEPMLHPELDAFVKICNKNNLDVKLTTNGSMLHTYIDNIEMFNNINQLNLSMHSYIDSKDYDFESINKIFDVVDKILEKTDSIVSFRFWNMTNDISNIENIELYKLIEDKYNLTDLKRKLIESKSIKIKGKLYINQDNKFIWPDTHLQYDHTCGKCYALKKQIAILVDGTIVPCCLDNNGDIALGNIFNDTIEDVINSDRARYMINGFEKGILHEELCKNCDFIKKFKN